MDALWNEIASAVKSGREDLKIDLKEEITLDGKNDKAEFAKDVSAIANTSGGTGYMVIGVIDPRHRKSNSPEDYIKGFYHHNIDSFEQQMQQALSNYVEPPPIFEFQTIIHPEVNRILGIVIIPGSSHRPHVFVRGSAKIEPGDIFVRRGSHTCKVCRGDILQIMDDYCQSKIDEELENKIILKDGSRIIKPRRTPKCVKS